MKANDVDGFKTKYENEWCLMTVVYYRDQVYGDVCVDAEGECLARRTGGLLMRAIDH